ncbi:MAG TPA: DUF4747 family protein [Candidatus Baltobacteraceae bacterium]|nr:DUF4747 family protein [Candidatus Baltobacteraceae bacterium]
MRQIATIRVSAINLVIMAEEKHNPESYLELLRDLAKMGHAVPVRGEQHFEMNTSVRVSDSGEMAYGTLHRFTDVDAMNWYNTEKHRRASDAERHKIVVPQNMAANYREIPYALSFKSHTFVFLTKSTQSMTSAAQIQNYFTKAFSYPEIYMKWGSVVANIEQDEEQLDKILDSEGIKMLRITVNRPNESFRKYDDELYERLRKMGVKSETDQFHADDKVNIKPDEDARAKAKAAISNGQVDAKVLVDGLIENFSTADKPLTEREEYNTKLESLYQAFQRAVGKILKRISREAKRE